MAEINKPKTPGKGGENTLNLIGTLAGIAGKLFFPDSGIDLSAPFFAGSQMMRQSREEKNLLELLQGNPHTAPVAEYGQALAGAGGLPNNMDLLDHPEVQQAFGGGDTAGILPGEQGGVPTAPVTPPVDFTSNEFLANMARLRPDLAEKVLSAKAVKDPADQTKELLQTILLGKQITNLETPEQKRQAALEDKMFQTRERIAMQGAQTQENQSNALALRKSQITPKEAESIGDIDTLRNSYRNTLLDVEQGFSPSVGKEAIASLLPGGERLMQTVDPKWTNARKNIQQSLALFQKSISGVAISEAEAKRLRPTMPGAGDDPTVFKNTLENNAKKATELSLVKLMNIANRGGDVSQYTDEDSLRLYKAVRAAMQHNLGEALSNPRVMQIRQQLGIDYGAGNP